MLRHAFTTLTYFTFIGIAATGLLSCGSTGYGLRPAVQALPGGVKKISVPVFENDTHQERAGAIVADSLLRILQSRGDVSFADSSKSAEGTFRGRVKSFSLSPSNVNVIPDPSGRGLPSTSVLAQEFQLKLTVELTLWDENKKRALWSREMTRTEVVPASVLQLEEQGAAMNTPINESRGRIYLRIAADRWAEDIYNELVASF